MSEFTNKYPMPETTMKALIKDGWVTCSLPQYEEIIIIYKQTKSVQKTADHFNCSRVHVYNVVRKLLC